MHSYLALFTYNRLDNTQRVLESLMQNAETKGSDFFIFSDGPKNEKAAEGVISNREYLHSFKDSLYLREGWGGSKKEIKSLLLDYSKIQFTPPTIVSFVAR